VLTGLWVCWYTDGRVSVLRHKPRLTSIFHRHSLPHRTEMQEDLQKLPPGFPRGALPQPPFPQLAPTMGQMHTLMPTQSLQPTQQLDRCKLQQDDQKHRLPAKVHILCLQNIHCSCRCIRISFAAVLSKFLIKLCKTHCAINTLFVLEGSCVYVYVYAFSRRFYPKRLLTLSLFF